MKNIDLNEVASHILAVLQLRHVGRDEAIKRDALLKTLQDRMRDPLLTDRQMRKSIEKCAPQVCSGSTGYFLPMTDAESLKAARYIEKKIFGLYARRRAILEAHPKIGPTQLELRP
jgi:hypothetical protein